MNKKVIAVAISSALGAPAFAHAQESNVQVFGRLNAEYAVHASQGQGPRGERVDVDTIQTPSSEIGFKGEETLGGGLAAWFQCASTADVRGQTQAGFCSRNSGLGLKGSYGNVWVGNWDTPFKRIAGSNVVFPQTGIGGVSFLLFGGSTTTNGRDLPGVFARRQNNSINVDLPSVRGLQLMLSTSSTNQATAATTSAAGAKPRLYSAGARYDNGPLNVGLAWEQHRNFQPAIANAGSDTGWLITTGYTLGAVRLGGLYTQQKFDTGPGAELKASAWHVVGDWRFSGPHGIRAGYTKAQDTTGGGAAVTGSNSVRAASGPDTGASLWQVRYYQVLSKRTEIDGGYVRLDNKASALYSLGGLSAPAGGADQSAWFVSMRHRF